MRFVFANGRVPVPSGISQWLCRLISQEVCPWNHKFADALSEPAFAAREFIAGKDASTLARDLLAMEQADLQRGVSEVADEAREARRAAAQRVSS